MQASTLRRIGSGLVLAGGVAALWLVVDFFSVDLDAAAVKAAKPTNPRYVGGRAPGDELPVVLDETTVRTTLPADYPDYLKGPSR